MSELATKHMFMSHHYATDKLALMYDFKMNLADNLLKDFSGNGMNVVPNESISISNGRLIANSSSSSLSMTACGLLAEYDAKKDGLTVEMVIDSPGPLKWTDVNNCTVQLSDKSSIDYMGAFSHRFFEGYTWISLGGSHQAFVGLRPPKTTTTLQFIKSRKLDDNTVICNCYDGSSVQQLKTTVKDSTLDKISFLTLFAQKWDTSTAYPGGIHCIRIYTKELSEEERLANYAIDRERFGT